MTKRFFMMLAAALAAVMGLNADTPVDAAIEKVRKEMAPDRRQTVFDVKAQSRPDGSVVLKGKMSDRAIHEALLSSLDELSSVRVIDSITLLPDTLWGQVRISFACMRSAPKYSSELSTQALMGMPVRLLEESGGWWYIQAPDGYLGWVWGSSIAKKTPDQLAQWRKAPRLVVTSLYQIQAYADAYTDSPRETVTDLLPGAIVEGNISDVVNSRVQVTLPDGRKAWAPVKDLTPVEQWAAQNFDADVILDQAYALEGAPYLWGGTTAKATDCSGLVKVSYLANGLMLRRDASQQALIGEHLDPEDWRDYEAGDLMFFGEKPGGRVTHVAIYDGDGWFVHCAGLVRRNSIDPDSPAYVNRIFFGGSRIHGHEGSEGITYVRDHPWYF